MQVEVTYCIIDEILKVIMPKSKVGRKPKLSPSESITILVTGQSKGYATDKQLYELITCGELRGCFKVPSYAQFNRTIRASYKYFDYVIQQLIQVHAGARNLYIIDSTALPINQFNGPTVKWGLNDARVAKNMHGWYQGYKLHIITNDRLEIVSVMVTQANFHDVNALNVNDFMSKIKGNLIGDKGYIANEATKIKLTCSGINLITKQRQNMDAHLNYYYRKLLRKRRSIERVFAYLKRSLAALRRFARTKENFISHVLASVIAYILRFTKEKALVEAVF